MTDQTARVFELLAAANDAQAIVERQSTIGRSKLMAAELELRKIVEAQEGTLNSLNCPPASFQPVPSVETPADWSDAPDWAMWRAWDWTVARSYHEENPTPQKIIWASTGRYKTSGGGDECPNWRETLEERPSADSTGQRVEGV